MRPRLRVLLGGGGVGKTTLAASLALALARRGRRVGLLGIDPARRLRSALGLRELTDLPADVALGGELAWSGNQERSGDPERRDLARAGVGGSLRAAVLRPEQTLRRWASESRLGIGGAKQLWANPLFALLADGLASSTDALAAGRLVEWAEHEPELDELIVDTAPGLPALEFLSKPDQIVALLEGRLFGWLGGRGRRLGFGAQGFGVPRFAGGLVRVAGLGLFVQAAEMIEQLRDCLATFGRRAGEARDWFRADSTQLLLVAGHGRTAECGQLDAALARLGLAPAAVVLNRALPESLAAEGSRLAAGGSTLGVGAQREDERAFRAWLRALARQQEEARTALAALAVPLLTAPRATFDSRSDALAGIGAALLAQLDALSLPPQPLRSLAR